MQVRVTSIAWKDVSERIRSETTEMQSALAASLKELSFGGGIDQVTIVIIAASSEDAENDKLCKGYDKIGRVSNPFTKQSIKSFGLAVPLNSDVFEGASKAELRNIICAAALKKIANPVVRIPKNFDYGSFSQHLSVAIANFSGTMIN